MTLRIAWFSTGRGEGSRNLLKAVMSEIRSGELDVDIAVVFSNREYGEHEGSDAFLTLVSSYGLPLETLSSARFRREHGGELSQPDRALPAWRQAYDAEVAKRLAGYDFAFGMLAGYMLICTEELCNRYTLLNLHPAPPGGPAGTWQEVIRTLIKTRANQAGAIIHVVTPELDQGPPITYATFSLQGPAFDSLWVDVDLSSEEAIETSALFAAIRRAGVQRELPLVTGTLKVLTEKDLGALLCAGQALDLNREVEERIEHQ